MTYLCKEKTDVRDSAEVEKENRDENIYFRIVDECVFGVR
jgi:hypothetical protein